jgi:hypothetical protein
MQSVHISIAEPCHENWEAMLEAEKGKFCLSCQKQVVDFSNMTDNEVLKYISNATGSTCGRFMPDQLDKTITKPREAHFSWKYILRFLLPAFLMTNKAKAQMGMVAYRPTHTAPAKTIPKDEPAFKGKITDSLSGLPIAAASIKIKGHSTGTQSGEDGSFALPNPMKLKNIELEISCIGYAEKTISADDLATVAEIELSPSAVMMEKIVITSGDYGGCPKRMGAYSMVTTRMIYDVPLVQRITDSLSGKNKIKNYPNPAYRGSTVNLDMKNVETGEYVLHLCNTAGAVVMQEKVTVPAKQFIFQWQLSSNLAAGNYILRISNTKNKLIYTGKITAL